MSLPRFPLLIVCLWWVGAASAQSIGVNFVGGRHTSGPDGSRVSGAAGVILQGNWNNIGAWSETMNDGGGGDVRADGMAMDLVDSTGAPTTTDVTWASDNTFAALNPSIDNEDERLMDGYIDLSGADRKVIVDFTDLPYSTYDVYVYVGSDGQTGRVSEVFVNDRESIFYEANTGGGDFGGRGDYLQATATAADEAFQANYALFSQVTDPNLTVTINGDCDGCNSNSGIHGIQIVQTLIPSLLWIDSRTGQAFIEGGDAIAIPLNSIEVSSPAGALLVDGYNSLGSQGLDVVDGPFDADDIAGNSPGESWQVSFASNERILEGFLLGSTAIADNDVLSLGRLFDPAASRDNDLAFSYGTAGGATTIGVVQYFESEALAGDYNADGFVDAADYTVYRDTLGSSSDLRADGDGDGQITSADYDIWFAAFGQRVAPPGTAVAVPEPAAATLVLLALLTPRALRRN